MPILEASEVAAGSLTLTNNIGTLDGAGAFLTDIPIDVSRPASFFQFWTP